MTAENADIRELLDHLVLATPDLPGTVADLEKRLGVRASEGGQHPGRGTRNALIALSDRSYLEIVSADPLQPTPQGPRWLRVDSVTAATLVAWAARSSDLEGTIVAASKHGVHLGPILTGRRKRPDGESLSWRFTDPTTVVADGLVPFLIDWGAGPHPAATASQGLGFHSLRARHPHPHIVLAQLHALGIKLQVDHGPEPCLVACLSGPCGLVELS